jgi:predicted ferric reductase
VRAVAILGAYALLVLLPLLSAALADPIAAQRPWHIELASAAGLLALGVVALEFALVARLRPVNIPFGSDALMLFHRRMGIAGVVLVGAHVVLLPLRPTELLGLGGSPALRAGALAAWALLALVALSVTRRRMGVRYERWLFGHRALATIVLPAMLVHSLGMQAYTASTSVRWAIGLHGGLLAVIALDYRVRRPLREQRRPWRVTDTRQEGADVGRITLEPEGHAGLRFEPGQFVWLRTSPRWWSSQEHPISIASSSERRSVELAIGARGDWSRRCIEELVPGARAWLDGPYGAFTPDRAAAERLILVGGGTGIAPLRSMLLSLRDRGDRRPILLVHASRDREHALFEREFESLRNELALEIVRVHEVCDGSDGCELGRIDRALLQRRVNWDLRRTHAFVCGPPALMDVVQETLLELGLPAANTHTERFDMV